MNKPHLIFALLVLVVASCTQKTSNPDFSKMENSILIIYSSGQPYKTISDIKPEEADAYTGATPADMNVDMLSKMLAAKLQEKNYTIRLAKASEIKDYRELLQYQMLVLGTPTYFWNMHWEVKKMMDESFEKIYIARRDDFKAMKHAVFAMAEYGDCAVNAIRQTEFGITDCSAKLSTSQVFIAKQTRPEYEAQVDRFASAIDSVMQAK